MMLEQQVQLPRVHAHLIYKKTSKCVFMISKLIKRTLPVRCFLFYRTKKVLPFIVHRSVGSRTFQLQ